MYYTRATQARLRRFNKNNIRCKKMHRKKYGNFFFCKNNKLIQYKIAKNESFCYSFNIDYRNEGTAT